MGHPSDLKKRNLLWVSEGEWRWQGIQMKRPRWETNEKGRAVNVVQETLE